MAKQYEINYGLQDYTNNVRQPGRSTRHTAGPFSSKVEAERCLANLATNPEFTGGRIEQTDADC